MNGRATLKLNLLAVAAMTALPAVVKADDFVYSGAVGYRSSHVQYTPVRHTRTRVIRYDYPTVYRSCRTPRVRTTVTYATPVVPAWGYPTQPTVTRVVRTTRPVYVDRRVSYRPGYPVHRHRPVIVRTHRPYYPGHRSVRYPRRHRSHGWGFNVGFHGGHGGHRGGGFGFHFGH